MNVNSLSSLKSLYQHATPHVGVFYSEAVDLMDWKNGRTVAFLNRRGIYNHKHMHAFESV